MKNIVELMETGIYIAKSTQICNQHLAFIFS